MRTKILPETALDVLKRNAIVYTALRRTRIGLGKFVPPRHVPGVSGRVHFNDFMFTSDAEAQQWYVEGAENVVGFIDRSLSASGRALDEFRGVLDFGSGYGHVIRLLVQRMDPTRVYAADVIREAVDYCATEFGVNPIYPAPGKAIRKLPPMDLIYAISVLTHLPEQHSCMLLRSWGESIESGGILVFTTHGPVSLANLERYGRSLWSRKAQLESDFNSQGFVYAPYEHHLGNDYGIAWHSREYVEMTSASYLPDFKQLFYESAGLDGHQDVYAYQRSYESSQS